MSATPAPGRDRSARADIVWTLLGLGFPREVADAWASGWACRLDASVVGRQALAFDDHGGFTVDQAIEWHQSGFYMPEAGWWLDAKYTPQQANATLALLPYDEDADEWLASGLPPHRVIAYLRAKANLREALEFENEGVSEEALWVVAGLLGR